MRKTRGFAWAYIVVGGVAAGIALFHSSWKSDQKTQTTANLKPSNFLPSSASSSVEQPKAANPRSPASVAANHGDTSADTDHSKAKTDEKETAEKASAPAAVAAAPISNACVNDEIKGAGFAATRISTVDWAKVIDEFHGAKAGLIGWLGKYKQTIPGDVYSMMESQIRKIRIQRPPVPEQPDLAWRGIGVWSHMEGPVGVSANDGVIRLGGGFVKLVQKDHKRARFELARLLAQSWAPCELKQLTLWEPLLKCLSATDGVEACSDGTFSEAGWAVSTAVAAMVSPPGCTIPAFGTPEGLACLQKSPFRTISSWKEARR